MDTKPNHDMRATIQFLEERFNRFNRDIFLGRLPLPTMHISSARTFMGQFKVQIVRKGLRRSETQHLTLSNRYDLPENTIEDILIHEMIHLLIHVEKIKDTSAHGNFFRRYMLEINERFGRHITVSHRCTREELQSDTGKAHSIICLCTMKDGKRLMCRVAQSRIFRLRRAFDEWDQVIGQEWYLVYGNRFNSLPRVLTPRLFSVDAEGISVIESGVRLEFAEVSGGRTILRAAGATRR